MKNIIILSWFLFCATVISAQVIEDESDNIDSADSVNFSAEEMVPDSIVLNDSVVITDAADILYMSRLAEINSPINYVYNEKVKAYIELYTVRRREQMERMLGLSEYYFPMFEAALDAKNMPMELKYLPIIESALNTHALSRTGASGLWQFMYYTGKQYGLTVNSYIDERRDPLKASASAVQFLSDLYKMYDDWFLAIAAYNCGPGNVNKAIRRSGGHRDFWSIYYLLPRETRGYVPAFIAATYAFTYAKEHNLSALKADLPMATDTIMVNQLLHFDQIAAVLNVNVQYLRDLNPQYRLDIIPAKTSSYPLRLGFDLASEFAAIEDTIYAFNKDKYFSSGALVAHPVEGANHHGASISGKKKLYYTVKSGDALGLISSWYDVNVSDLKRWNNINRNLIRVGQRLAIYVPSNKSDYYSKINSMKLADKQRASGNSVADNAAASSKPSSADASSDYVYYTVRSGDNLWSIAQKYDGVTNKDLMHLNNISDARKISVGQKLKIKPKS